MSSGSSPISSRNRVPPLASWNLPRCLSWAPVNAPFSWPNRMDSTRFSGRAPQLTATSGRDARSLAGARVAAIGPGTAEALAANGISADIVPERSVAEGLVEALAGLQVSRALIARARVARDVLPDALAQRGSQVDVLELYETVPEPLSARTLSLAARADYVTFTSSSTVRFYLQAAAADGAGSTPFSKGTRIVSIGPITSETLAEHGLAPHVQAERHDVQGVIDALLADAAAHPAR